MSSHVFHLKKLLVKIKNMKIIDIPTRSSLIYIQAKQTHYKSKSKPVGVVKNMASWNDPIEIKCIFPKNEIKSKKKFMIRLSFRFQTESTSGFKRYGVVQLDIAGITYRRESHFEKGLNHCLDNAMFTCDLEYNLDDNDPINEWTEASPSQPPKSSSFYSLSENNQGSNNELSMETSKDQCSNSDQKTNSETLSGTELNFRLCGDVMIKVNSQRMKTLEEQVDSVIASMINESY
ncbi:hypothetical protein TRFO_14632 [Tritrichomonas foetus]|uniref:C2 NT-type domain-containing protein n=1 Tax=Tritrichomonas foetus TaxID=1144522 RepID=A0A1J4KVQ1_9EUKA|nr:hypothetical protein TRFO_14632 [Tritrichomonas foetus]|eukprot:OHT14968.1 hypothetical protein TRFO_14632 [Tritrichomonas foetus]